MKHLTVILLIAVAATLVPFSHARADMFFGVMGGMTSSDWWGDGAGGPDMKGGFLGGAFFTYMTHGSFLLFENTGYQAELLFHRKGVREGSMGGDATWTLDYLEIPLLFKMEIPPSSSFSKGFLMIGPAFAFNINSKKKVEYLGESVELDVSDSMSDIDIGFVLGLNGNYDIGSLNVVLDLRYTLGLMTIDDAVDGAVRNSALSFMVGVALPYGSTD